MSVLATLAAIAVLALAAWFLARQRALASVQGNPRLLHSLPAYYGWYAALSVLVPALSALVLWLIVQPVLVESRVSATLPAAMVADATSAELTMADVRRVAGGLDAAVAQGLLSGEAATRLSTGDTDVRDLLASVGVALGGEVSPEVLTAAQDYRTQSHWGAAGRTVLVLALAVLGLFRGVTRAHGDFRARNRVERVILALLIAASSIAILTTVGIVWSMVSETLDFFSEYPIQDFFFSLTWSPNFRGGSDLGILPLIWGTMYITLVSMLVAIPIGLFAAIYLAEYASKPVRNWVKPLIEIIAGIPTVVFGIFALVTVGPFLRDWFAAPLGLGNSGSSVMTAGIVIGSLSQRTIDAWTDTFANSPVPQEDITRLTAYLLSQPWYNQHRERVTASALIRVWPGWVASGRPSSERVATSRATAAVQDRGAQRDEEMKVLAQKIADERGEVFNGAVPSYWTADQRVAHANGGGE